MVVGAAILRTMRAFHRSIGIDYSGAETPTASLKGLCVYMAVGDAAPTEVLPRPRHRNTGPGAPSRNGSLSAWPRMSRRWSVSTTASPSRCAILRPMACGPTGRPSSTTSSAIGQPTKITPMLILFGTGRSAMARRGRETPGGGG